MMIGIQALARSQRYHPPIFMRVLSLFTLRVRFLYASGRVDEARAVLCRVQALPETDPAVQTELREIATELEAEQHSQWSQLWTQPGLRRAMVVACGLQFFQQFGGINTAMYGQHTSVLFCVSCGFVSFHVFGCAGTIRRSFSSLPASTTKPRRFCSPTPWHSRIC